MHMLRRRRGWRAGCSLASVDGSSVALSLGGTLGSLGESFVGAMMQRQQEQEHVDLKLRQAAAAAFCDDDDGDGTNSTDIAEAAAMAESGGGSGQSVSPAFPAEACSPPSSEETEASTGLLWETLCEARPESPP